MVASPAQSLIRLHTPCTWRSFANGKLGSEEIEGYLEGLREKLIEEGPAALEPSEHFALLWDPDSLRWLHHEFWSRPAVRLHPWWRERLDGVTERIGLAR
jgi:hypothetical protein